MADGVTFYIDGKPAPVKVLLDTLYRPFGNAGKAFERTIPDRREAGAPSVVPWADRRCSHLRPVLNAEEIAAMSVDRSVNAARPRPDGAHRAEKRACAGTSWRTRQIRQFARLGSASSRLQREREAAGAHIPDRHGDGGESEAEGHLPADPRRL